MISLPYFFRSATALTFAAAVATAALVSARAETARSKPAVSTRILTKRRIHLENRHNPTDLKARLTTGFW